MKVVLAEHSGFCPGVKRAVDTAKKNYGENVCILGEIIHNESVTDEIKKLGTKIVDCVDEVDRDIVIIRSHGVGKDVYEELKEKKVKIVDCTCPFVAKIHDIVEKYYELGYKIVITGEKNHPEVIGINGWCGNEAIVIDENYREIDLGESEKVCLYRKQPIL